MGWHPGKTLSASKGPVSLLLLSCLQFKQRKKVPCVCLAGSGPATRANPISAWPPPNLINPLSFETLSGRAEISSPPRPIRSAADIHGASRPSAWPGPRQRPPPRDLIFRQEIGWQHPARRACWDRHSALERVTGRPDPPYQGWPTKAAGQGDYRSWVCGVRPISVTQTD